MQFELTDDFLAELREAIHEQNWAFVSEQLKELYPPDIAEIFNKLKIEEAKYVYKQLDEQLAADVLVELEDDVFCGPSMVFTNVVNPRAHVSRKKEYRRTLVRRGATIGANATIVCGITLDEYAFVGAGSVVTKDVGAYALVVGVPARRVGWMCQCGERLRDNNPEACKVCGTRYKQEGDRLRRVSG